jgi:hypothetical protein
MYLVARRGCIPSVPEVAVYDGIFMPLRGLALSPVT